MWRPNAPSSQHTAKRYDSALRFGVQWAQARSRSTAQVGVSALRAAPVRPAPSDAALGRRLAQWCIAHPPAINAAPISASRWRSTPVNASDLDGMAAAPEVIAGDVLGPVPGVEVGPSDAGAVGPSSGGSPVGGGGGVCPGGSPPPPPRASERDAPAAGLAVMISGATQAAAPAVATADIRPNACRLESVRADGASPGAVGDRPPSRSDPCLRIQPVPYCPIPRQYSPTPADTVLPPLHVETGAFDRLPQTLDGSTTVPFST